MATTTRRAAGLAAALLSLLWAAPALACTPPPGGLPHYSIAQRVAAADVVLEGIVDSLATTSIPDDTATISVLQVFKGNQPGSVTIVGFGPGSLCRSSVQVGQHLIFFARVTANGLQASYMGQFDATEPANQDTIAQVIAALNLAPRAYLPLASSFAAAGAGPPSAPAPGAAPLLAGSAALALLAGVAWRRRRPA